MIFLASWPYGVALPTIWPPNMAFLGAHALSNGFQMLLSLEEVYVEVYSNICRLATHFLWCLLYILLLLKD